MKAIYTVVFDRENDGSIIASVPGIPGCHVYGRTRATALRRVRSALRFFKVLRDAGAQAGDFLPVL
ncbi:MAG: type II toxin-antitoxin system HicB family antitoxin [Planctomycetes bacterium]|nr:type II toxin-antitoxin system HicB family antitoxin [Planctomycetota bacterium]